MAEGNQTGAFFGNSVSAAGDVNGDGYGDVIVGAKWYGNGQTEEGRAYVYHGSASRLSATEDWKAESDQASAKYGSSVFTAGDVNGDGYADIIVGAFGYPGPSTRGVAFVHHGSASGLSATPALNNQTTGVTFSSSSPAGRIIHRSITCQIKIYAVSL